jgi:aminoglycoside phosphotransferase (APT) family kinase protein
MIKDIYYQRGFPDPVFENDYVLSLVRPFVPGVQEVARVDETGGEARTYAVDNNIILKVQRPQQLRLSTSLEREVFFLKQLEKYDASISVPRVLGYGKEGTVEYTVMTRMPGKAVRYSDLTAKQRECMYFELGKTLAKIHGIDKNVFVESGLFPDIDTPSDIRERCKLRFERVAKWILERSTHLTQADIDDAREQVTAVIEKIPDAEILAALHSNPGPEHVFVDDNGTFSGVIDFGDAYISHPVCDFRSTPIRDRSLLLEGYKSLTELNDNFKQIWNAVYAIDDIVDVLRNKL